MSEISIEQVASRLPRERRILITAHENPDGDALGCVVALMLVAERLGVAHEGYIPGTNGFPPEYCFLPRTEEILRGPFPSVGPEVTVYILDCATAGRLDPEGLRCAGSCINIDHHQDNTRFAPFNLIDVTAASTTQILFDIIVAGDLPLDAEISQALYVGLVTDTGRFQYSNTTPAAHCMAAVLQEQGVDVNAVFRFLYEGVPAAKLRLLARALERLDVRLDGELALAYLDLDDLEAAGAEEGMTEGIVDTLRTIRGARVVGFAREREKDGGRELKVSLRSTDGTVNVADIAHRWNGGGHVQAAGFSAEESPEALFERLEEEVAARL